MLTRLRKQRRAFVCGIFYQWQGSMRIHIPRTLFCLLTSSMRNTFRAIHVYRSNSRCLFSIQFNNPYILSRTNKINKRVTRIRRNGSFTFCFFGRGTWSTNLLFFIFKRGCRSNSMFSFFKCKSTLRRSRFIKGLWRSSNSITNFIVNSFHTSITRIFRCLWYKICRFVQLITVGISCRTCTTDIVFINYIVGAYLLYFCRCYCLWFVVVLIYVSCYSTGMTGLFLFSRRLVLSFSGGVRSYISMLRFIMCVAFLFGV